MTLADYTVIGVPPDLTEAEFVAILDAAHSPALGAASAVWNYCRRRGVSPAMKRPVEGSRGRGWRD